MTSTSPEYVVIEDGPRKAYICRRLPGCTDRYAVMAEARRGLARDLVDALTRVHQADAVIHELKTISEAPREQAAA
ncbi:MAG: hypothetical protein ACXVDA_14560 [Ktedonobacterales bacterium]